MSKESDTAVELHLNLIRFESRVGGFCMGDCEITEVPEATTGYVLYEKDDDCHRAVFVDGID